MDFLSHDDDDDMMLQDQMMSSATKKATRIFVARIPPTVTEPMFQKYNYNIFSHEHSVYMSRYLFLLTDSTFLQLLCHIWWDY